MNVSLVDTYKYGKRKMRGKRSRKGRGRLRAGEGWGGWFYKNKLRNLKTGVKSSREGASASPSQ